MCCDGAACAKRCIKGKQDIVNDDCTVCDFNPWRVVAGLTWALVFAEGAGSQFN